jgi:hypothetical protein
MDKQLNEAQHQHRGILQLLQKLKHKKLIRNKPSENWRLGLGAAKVSDSDAQREIDEANIEAVGRRKFHKADKQRHLEALSRSAVEFDLEIAPSTSAPPVVSSLAGSSPVRSNGTASSTSHNDGKKQSSSSSSNGSSKRSRSALENDTSPPPPPPPPPPPRVHEKVQADKPKTIPEFLLNSRIKVGAGNVPQRPLGIQVLAGGTVGGAVGVALGTTSDSNQNAVSVALGQTAGAVGVPALTKASVLATTANRAPRPAVGSALDADFDNVNWEDSGDEAE